MRLHETKLQCSAKKSLKCFFSLISLFIIYSKKYYQSKAASKGCPQRPPLKTAPKKLPKKVTPKTAPEAYPKVQTLFAQSCPNSTQILPKFCPNPSQRLYTSKYFLPGPPFHQTNLQLWHFSPTKIQVFYE